MLKLTLKDETLIIKCLLKNLVGIIPTDTVYGLVGIYGNVDVAHKIARLKFQKIVKPIAVIVSSIAMAKSIAVVNKKAIDLWKQSLPGKLTLILPSKVKIQKTIAIRITVNSWLVNIINQTGPLYATSANIHGEKPITNIKDNILDADFIVEGNTINNEPSTIIDLTNDKYQIIRQ